MASLFPQIYDCIHKNPHKNATLRWREPMATEGSCDQEKWDIFSVKPLQPPGALSMLCMIEDPMYEMGSLALKKQILMEKLLVLHDRIDKELVGRRYPRKKIQDLLAAQVSAQSPTTSVLLEGALCELFQIQKVHLHRKSKQITFSPPDLRTWSSDRKVMFGEEDNCWFFTPEQSTSLQNWLVQKEDDGWSIAWPTADGKFEDLKAALVTRNISYSGKHKKDDLAIILGRRQALESLNQLNLQTC